MSKCKAPNCELKPFVGCEESEFCNLGDPDASPQITNPTCTPKPGNERNSFTFEQDECAAGIDEKSPTAQLECEGRKGCKWDYGTGSKLVKMCEADLFNCNLTGDLDNDRFIMEDKETYGCNAVKCDEKNNYGPIWEYLSIEMNVQIVSILLASLIIILSLIIYVKLFNTLQFDKFILQFLFISPPIVFGLERSQFDIHFVLISLYALLIFKKNKLLAYLLICFSIQVKLYPIFLFAGMIFYFYKMKETKNLIESIFLLVMNSSVLIFYYFNVNFSERIQDQSGISQTYGIQSHAKNYYDFLNIDLFFGYLIQLIIICLFIGYFLKVRKNENIKLNLVYLSFTSMFLLSSLIGNIDFRLIILFIPLVFLLEEGVGFISISGLYLIASSPSMYFNGFENTNVNIITTIFETIPVLISHLSFFIVFSYFIYEFIFYFFKKETLVNK